MVAANDGWESARTSLVLSTENFLRFNDSILQGCLLRAADQSKLDYSSSPQHSRLMKEFLLKVFARHATTYALDDPANPCRRPIANAPLVGALQPCISTVHANVRRCVSSPQRPRRPPSVPRALMKPSLEHGKTSRKRVSGRPYVSTVNRTESAPEVPGVNAHNARPLQPLLDDSGSRLVSRCCSLVPGLPRSFNGSMYRRRSNIGCWRRSCNDGACGRGSRPGAVLALSLR